MQPTGVGCTWIHLGRGCANAPLGSCEDKATELLLRAGSHGSSLSALAWSWGGQNSCVCECGVVCVRVWR